jgi:hypothetical protein
MDGEHRFEIVRDHIRQQHDLASLERSARRRLTPSPRDQQPGWTTGIVSVVGTLTRRAARRPFSA